MEPTCNTQVNLRCTLSAELPKCVCPSIVTAGTGHNGSDCDSRGVGEHCTMTC